MRRIVGVFVACSLVAVIVSGCGGGRSSRTIEVTIGKRHERLPLGTTLAAAAKAFHLAPRAGDLLDVNGRVLRRGAFPGHLVVDGRRVAASTRLAAGSRLAVVAGRTHTEQLRRQVLPVAGGSIADPQFTLSRTPGVDVVVRGAVSNELVSARFEPRGGRTKVERAVALTFDDGPSPLETPKILRVLARLHVHATFFVIGYLAAAYPDIVRLERRRGMVVGNHSYNHPEVPPFDVLPAPLMRDEIALGASSLARAEVHPHLFRPPGGGYSRALVRQAKALGERLVLWSVDPADWKAGVSTQQIVSRVLSTVRPGSIVILHDGGGDRSATIRALPKIVKAIRKRHLRLVTLPDVPPDLAG